jgi:O-antigen/teichoic acid export membrane protein
MKASNRFYSSLGLLIMLNVIIKPVWIFAIERQVQNSVGNLLYGTYFSLLNLTLMGGFLLDWGVSAYLNRQMASGENSFTRQVSRFLSLKLLFSGLYTAVILLIAWLSGTERWDILGLAIAIQVLSSFFIFLRGIVTAQQWFRADAWLSVLDKTLMILVCGSFLYLPAVAGNISIEKFLLAQVACTAIAILVAVGLLQKKGFRFSAGGDHLPRKQLLRSALPYALIILLMTLHYRLDGFLLGLIKNEYEAGIYAAAYRILDAANMVGYLAAGFLLPFIARRWSMGQSFNGVVLDIRHGLMLFSLSTAIVFFFLAGWFQELLYNNPASSATEVLQWCLPALIGYSLVQVYGTVLTATGHIVSFCYIALGAAIINTLLNILLIPLLGAKGSCWAAIFSQGLFGIASLLLARKKCGVTLHPGSWLLYIFIGAILTGSLYWFRLKELNAVVQIALAGMIVIIAAFATRLVSIKKWTAFSGSTGS